MCYTLDIQWWKKHIKIVVLLHIYSMTQTLNKWANESYDMQQWRGPWREWSRARITGLTLWNETMQYPGQSKAIVIATSITIVLPPGSAPHLDFPLAIHRHITFRMSKAIFILPLLSFTVLPTLVRSTHVPADHGSTTLYSGLVLPLNLTWFAPPTFLSCPTVS